MKALCFFQSIRSQTTCSSKIGPILTSHAFSTSSPINTPIKPEKSSTLKSKVKDMLGNQLKDTTSTSFPFVPLKDAPTVKAKASSINIPSDIQVLDNTPKNPITPPAVGLHLRTIFNLNKLRTWRNEAPYLNNTEFLEGAMQGFINLQTLCSQGRYAELKQLVDKPAYMYFIQNSNPAQWTKPESQKYYNEWRMDPLFWCPVRSDNGNRLITVFFDECTHEEFDYRDISENGVDKVEFFQVVGYSAWRSLNRKQSYSGEFSFAFAQHKYLQFLWRSEYNLQDKTYTNWRLRDVLHSRTEHIRINKDEEEMHAIGATRRALSERDLRGEINYSKEQSHEDYRAVLNNFYQLWTHPVAWKAFKEYQETVLADSKSGVAPPTAKRYDEADRWAKSLKSYE